MSGKVRSIFGGQKYEYTRLGQVQNVKKSKVYVFADDDVAEEDVVEFEMNNVRTRRGKSAQSEASKEESPTFVERRLTDDDTLQSVSLQYGCPISEIKRLNNLIRDQDFYGLTSIKIPVKQHSFLVDQIHEDDKKVGENVLKTTERSLSNGGATCLESEDDQSAYYDSEPDPSATDLSDPDAQRQVIRKISINRATRSQSKDAVKFLKDMDKDLSHILKTTRTDRNSLDEVISVLTHTSVNPLVMPQRKKSKYECVIEWRTTVTILVLVAVIAPLAALIYVLYFK